MNLRAMIERREVSHSTALQAARTLSHLTIALGIDARAEICALRVIPALLEVLDAAEYVSEAPKAGIELTAEDRTVFAARIAAARELLKQAE